MRWCTQVLLVAAVAFASLAAWCVLSLPESLVLPSGNDYGFEQHRSPALMQVIEKRYEAADDLLHGRSSLEDTIARFRELAQDDPLDVLQALHDTFPDVSSDDDLFFMQVYHYAETHAARLQIDDARMEPLRQALQRRQARTVPAEAPSTAGTAIAS